MTNGRTQHKALITGGARSFGLATATALLERGDRVTIANIDHRQIDAARAAFPAVVLHVVELDATLPASVGDTVEAYLSAHGGLDFLVNCAGIIHLAPLAEIPEEAWERVINADFKSTFCAHRQRRLP